ncbi:basic proline-rich protein-like [Cinclus cinclus]|uniref:basic proline-rich protein-like n=1 Tax=Cinclus cinclus TaxID=127875 RepID=UPI002E11E952
MWALLKVILGELRPAPAGWKRRSPPAGLNRPFPTAVRNRIPSGPGPAVPRCPHSPARGGARFHRRRRRRAPAVPGRAQERAAPRTASRAAVHRPLGGGMHRHRTGTAPGPAPHRHNTWTGTGTSPGPALHWHRSDSNTAMDTRAPAPAPHRSDSDSSTAARHTPAPGHPWHGTDRHQGFPHPPRVSVPQHRRAPQLGDTPMWLLGCAPAGNPQSSSSHSPATRCPPGPCPPVALPTFHPQPHVTSTAHHQ